MGRVEAFSAKQPALHSIADGLGMGLGYTWVLIGISMVRELLGNGSLFDIPVLGENYQPILFFTLPAGGFFVFSLFVSLGLFIKQRNSKMSVNRDKVGCC
jgi:electron transport complex protein RnfE